MYAEYSSGDPESFRTGKFVKKDNLLGFLHYPYERIDPIERNESVDQIQTSDETLRIRNKPSLDGEIVGHVQIGYYNVLSTKEADGYTWYEISKDRWCADITTTFLPAEDDFVKEFEQFLNSTKAKISSLENENQELKNDMKDIQKITGRWA